MLFRHLETVDSAGDVAVAPGSYQLTCKAYFHIFCKIFYWHFFTILFLSPSQDRPNIRIHQNRIYNNELKWLPIKIGGRFLSILFRLWLCHVKCIIIY